MLTSAERKARVLRAVEIPRRHGVTQDEVGAVGGASQPQVSRVLRGNLVRATKLSEDIYLYGERLDDGGVTLESVRFNDDLIEALRMTWDGSFTHARALASFIRSLAVLKQR